MASLQILLDKAPYVVCCVYTILLLLNPTKDLFWVILGQWTCNTTSSWLKDWIKEPRPVTSSQQGSGEYGMPSAHSASVSYTATICTFLPVLAFSQTQSQSTHTCVLIGLHLYAWTVAYSRIYLGHHSIKQVGFGYVGGTAFAVSWYVLRGYILGAVSV